jgi:uncharacterized membrane protein (DUF2068 family)
MGSSDYRLLRLIAAFKLLKAGLLIAVGVGAIKLLHKDLGDVADHWIRGAGLNPANHFVEAGVAKASNISPEQVKKLGIGSFIYAGLFSTEGVGLWLLKPWAEWVTVIITSSLLPIEIYEIHKHSSPARWIIFVLNIATVLYLLYRIHLRRAR